LGRGIEGRGAALYPPPHLSCIRAAVIPTEGRNLRLNIRTYDLFTLVIGEEIKDLNFELM